MPGNRRPIDRHLSGGDAPTGRPYGLAHFSFFVAAPVATDLATERGKYMQKCKKIREGMADEYETAGKRGISKNC